LRHWIKFLQLNIYSQSAQAVVIVRSWNFSGQDGVESKAG